MALHRNFIMRAGNTVFVLITYYFLSFPWTFLVYEHLMEVQSSNRPVCPAQPFAWLCLSPFFQMTPVGFVTEEASETYVKYTVEGE